MNARAITVAVVAVWSAAGAAVWWARASKPTAARVVRLMAEQPVAGRDAAARQKALDRVADAVIRLDAEERAALRASPEMRSFFESLEPAEKGAFLEKILPSGFRQMMRALNEMPRERRKKIVERAIADLRSEGAEGAVSPPPELDEAVVRRIAEEGLNAYYNESTAETKLDLAPLIEQLQRTLRATR